MKEIYEKLQQIAEGDVDGESHITLQISPDGFGCVVLETVWGGKEPLFNFNSFEELAVKVDEFSMAERKSEIEPPRRTCDCNWH